VYASHIERVVVRGSGIVTGLSWLPASAVDVFERFRTAPLPIGPGVRYAGPPDGQDEGFNRVKRGAPKRFGMHESPLASAPTGCAPATAADEVDRVTALTVEPSTSLDELINDTSAPQGQLSAIETVIDDSGKSLGTSERLLLMDLLHGAVDPGIARWLGFLDMDEFVPDESIIVAYIVDALFAPDWKGITDQSLLLTLLSGTVVKDGARAVRDMADERDGSWQVAQADWFGRWSGWARQGIAAASRPGPPRPTFTLTTTPPGVPVPVPTGTLAGRIRVEVSVPPVEGLPSGGRLLDQLLLTVTTSGGPVQTAHPWWRPAAESGRDHGAGPGAVRPGRDRLEPGRLHRLLVRRDGLARRPHRRGPGRTAGRGARVAIAACGPQA
jgi:hypothetical protein